MKGKKIMGERLSKSQRLEAELEDLILHGSYRVYDRFLSVSKLKKRYRASQATVVSALEHLEARGLIFRRSRSGIFVSPTSRTKEILIVSSASRAVSNELNQFSYGLGESPCASKAGWVTINCTAEDFEEYLPNLRIICKKLFAVVFFRCLPKLRFLFLSGWNRHRGDFTSGNQLMQLNRSRSTTCTMLF